MEIKGATVDGAWSVAVCRESVYGEVRLHTLERVHIRPPFNEGETIEHRKDTDVDAVVLQN